MDDLVSTDWLAANLKAADVVPVDCTWFMAASGRNARAEFAEAHIPGARFFDIDAASDASHPAPHMLPSAEDFGTAMSRAGIGSNDRIVVYDNSPLRTAVRGWFMLRHFGVDQVAVLDGGLGKWHAQAKSSACERFERALASLWSTLADGHASKAASKTRAPALGPVTYPARATCRTRISTTLTAR